MSRQDISKEIQHINRNIENVRGKLTKNGLSETEKEYYTARLSKYINKLKNIMKQSNTIPTRPVGPKPSSRSSVRSSRIKGRSRSQGGGKNKSKRRKSSFV
jgi:hypothetical protein